jgi:uncharacterized BrkB/YihY/UPF0761 family membrane protein
MSVDDIERLARRINWLDRNRRRLSVAISILLAPLFMLLLVWWLPPQWPKAHAACLAIATAAACWYGVETALGLVQAVWETDHNKLSGPATLPRAEVIRRK